MRILVLGGTVFLGHEVARHARDAGHDVTCLTRGESGTVPAGVTHVRADRSGPGAYGAVSGLDWDAVVDVSREPAQVRGALAALAARARHWTYVSSCSVYADQSAPHADEDAELAQPYPPDAASAPTAEDYPSAKSACELACRAALGDRLHVCRSGLLAGPGDRSDRVGYWPGRFARGGEVLVPEGDGTVQVLDVRDLAAFLVDLAERGAVLVANAVGETYTVARVVGESRAVSGDGGEPVVVSDEFLLERDVEPFMGAESLPLWIPMPDWAGFGHRSDTRAAQAGLGRRPLVETLTAALEDEHRLGLDRQPRRAGLSPRREAELLDAWRARD